MNSAQSGKMIVGLDIGTSKVVALVGEDHRLPIERLRLPRHTGG